MLHTKKYFQGDHSQGNVKFPDLALTYCGTPTNAALTRPQLKTAFSHFTHAILTWFLPSVLWNCWLGIRKKASGP